MTTIDRTRCLPWLLIAMCGMCGCGTRSYSVDGTVTFNDGSPAGTLAGGIVTFESADGKSSGQGVIQEDGSYSLVGRHGAGVPAGEYRVSVRPLPLQKTLIEAKYSAFGTSGLTALVKEQANSIPVQVGKSRDGAIKPKRVED